MTKQYFVYILTNYANTVLYTGVTSNLKKRVYEHKQKLVKSFTKRYNLWKLIYYEVYDDVKIAIKREKQIKNLVRRKKLVLIKAMNPDFKELRFD